MKELLNQKVPSGLEKSPVPPTPVAGSILDLIMSPISFATATADKAFRCQCFHGYSLCSCILINININIILTIGTM